MHSSEIASSPAEEAAIPGHASVQLLQLSNKICCLLLGHEAQQTRKAALHGALSQLLLSQHGTPIGSSSAGLSLTAREMDHLCPPGHPLARAVDTHAVLLDGQLNVLLLLPNSPGQHEQTAPAVSAWTLQHIVPWQRYASFCSTTE